MRAESWRSSDGLHFLRDYNFVHSIKWGKELFIMSNEHCIRRNEVVLWGASWYLNTLLGFSFTAIRFSLISSGHSLHTLPWMTGLLGCIVLFSFLFSYNWFYFDVALFSFRKMWLIVWRKPLHLARSLSGILVLTVPQVFQSLNFWVLSRKTLSGGSSLDSHVLLHSVFCYLDAFYRRIVFLWYSWGTVSGTLLNTVVHGCSSPLYKTGSICL